MSILIFQKISLIFPKINLICQREQPPISCKISLIRATDHPHQIARSPPQMPRSQRQRGAATTPSTLGRYSTTADRETPAPLKKPTKTPFTRSVRSTLPFSLTRHPLIAGTLEEISTFLGELILTV